ncbi:MAG: 4Fe-4S binding protein [Rubrobacteridae bacterium]|nr:4Fe-4S binding protein [Rubrobacteridae bacterium]
MKIELPGFFKNLSKHQISIRRVVQLSVALIVIMAGWHFYQFVGYIRGTGAEAFRPPVVEGFLPIAGIIAFKVFVASGFFDTIHPAGLTIFVSTIITALIFRRALCSWICPIGTLSEQLGKLGKKINGKNVTLPKWLDITLLSIKYLIFAAIFWVFASMSFNDAVVFMREPFYSLSDVRLFDMFAGIGVFGFAFILFLLVMSVFVKSFWCRYLCPYGALLGVIGLFSPIVLKKDSKSCARCGVCSKACVNGVDVAKKNNFVITAECMGCTSCVSACPKKGTLQFKLFGILRVSPLTFSIAFVVVFFAIIIIGAI